MNPVYLMINPPPSPFPFMDPNEEQHLQLFSPSSEGSSSSLSNSILFNPDQEQGGGHDTEQHQQHQEVHKYVLQGGSSDHHVFLQSPSLPTLENGLSKSLEASVCEGDQNHGVPVKWMSSKMRLMRKMMNSYQKGEDKQVGSGQKFQDHQQPPPSPLDTDNSSNHSSNDFINNNNNNMVRVCSDCNTTKTPLWRSGPRGPKSLCNACGIRQRKARRAMAAAAANGAVLENDTSSMSPKVHHKEKRSDNGYVQKYKKRCKLTDPCSRKKICFEDFTINLRKNTALFPQDEKEAAILLMALSCGLVHG